MVPVRINHSSHPPTVLFRHWNHSRRPGLHRSRKHCIRVGHRENHSDRTAPNRLGAEVLMLWRFITDPKLGSIHGKPSHHASARIFQSKSLASSKRLLVKLH